LVRSTNDEDATNSQASNSFDSLDDSQDEVFDQEVAAENEDVPDDDAASWTTYLSGGDTESPPTVPQDIKLSSVNPSIQSASVSNASSSVPQVIDVSSDCDNGSSAAINSIMSASTTVTRHLTISTASVRLINLNQWQHLVDEYLLRFEQYT